LHRLLGSSFSGRIGGFIDQFCTAHRTSFLEDSERLAIKNFLTCFDENSFRDPPYVSGLCGKSIVDRKGRSISTPEIAALADGCYQIDLQVVCNVRLKMLLTVIGRDDHRSSTSR
jgi:hypothetical protein